MIWAILLALAAAALVTILFRSWLRLRRAEFIRTYQWPAGLLDKLEKHNSNFSRKDTALVAQGLRQFFIAYLMSGRRYVSMPSQIADDLWHEFILYTREYNRFCQRAFGGFLHHTPAVVLSKHRKSNEGLRRVWWFCCKYESIDPADPTRLPLLFALDAKLNIQNGFVYHPQCDELRRHGSAAAAYCGGDFSSPSFDGNTAGFGDTGRYSAGDTFSIDGSAGDSGGSDAGGGGDSGGGSCGGGGCGGGGGD